MANNIEYTEDTVTIKDSNGNELYHWVMDEWTEDPEVAFAIFHAIEKACMGVLWSVCGQDCPICIAKREEVISRIASMK